ncbi:MAG: pitrilysin family protein [Bacteriovoracaceae bacterium]|nr:insulinase family protein [Bacteroidota bacterium]
MRKQFFVLLIISGTVFGQNVRINVPYEQFMLKNGLNVILHVDKTTPTVSVNEWFHVGSGYEKPGRTGFAHLFEHIMFEGSKNVPEGKFDEWLEAAGGSNNGSTNVDRTNYFEDIPSNALELSLFLDSDRMGFLLDDISQEKLDGQRDVVKNERRQSYENRPYGYAFLMLFESLYPKSHPYSWPTIGSMADLSAASLDDVKIFFRTYYAPNNASLSIAGDIDIANTKVMVEKWFNDVPIGKPVPQQDRTVAALREEIRMTVEDRVQLPRVYLGWLSPASLTPGDAELDLLASILAGGKNSRLYKKLVYELQIAQDVSAFQASAKLGSIFVISSTARAGHTLAEIEQVIQEEINAVKKDAPALRDLHRARNQYEASFIERLESVNGKADMLNNYYYLTGNPDYFNEDLARYYAIDPQDISTVAAKYLIDDGRVVISFVPKGKVELAAQNSPVVSTEGK